MTNETVTFQDGQVYLEGVSRPTFIYARTGYIRMGYGEYEQTLAKYEAMRTAYIKGGFPDMAEDLALIEVPPNQQLIDDMFQSTGLFRKYIQEMERSLTN